MMMMKKRRTLAKTNELTTGGAKRVRNTINQKKGKIQRRTTLGRDQNPRAYSFGVLLDTLLDLS